MGEKIIYINNVNNLPDIHKKQWIYYGKIEIIIKNNKKNIIIFDNINKIDEDEEIYSSIENNNRLFI